ncbi:MAG: hypothetical protein QOE08_663 [Thermoleophilaceae bacterium]|jgi:hypothetical protein|nr:hypothetical protein [Thermoleophilaceae bacterium]
MLHAVTRDARLRFAGLLAAGSLAVHQLRYAAGYGDHSSRALAEQGHGYLGDAGVFAALLLALALGSSLGAVVRARRAEARQPRLGSLWLAATGALSAIYATQELIEGTLAQGHPAGLAGIVGHGGWLAFAIASAVGALIALAMRGADAALAPRPARPVAPLGQTPPRPQLVPRPRLAMPAASFAASPPARGPPTASR